MKRFLKGTVDIKPTHIEGYPDYPLCLEPRDISAMIKEERLCREKYGYKKYSERTFNEFLRIKRLMTEEPQVY